MCDTILTDFFTNPALLFLTVDLVQFLIAGTLLVEDEPFSSSRSMLSMSHRDLVDCS